MRGAHPFRRGGPAWREELTGRKKGAAGWGVDTERFFGFYRARVESSLCR